MVEIENIAKEEENISKEGAANSQELGEYINYHLRQLTAASTGPIIRPVQGVVIRILTNKMLPVQSNNN